jgi:hypothetical protein
LPFKDPFLPTSTSTSTPNPTPKIITARLDASSGLSFTKYTISIPSDWVDKHTYENQGTPIDTLTLTKGNYQIKIYQAATGGAQCIYPSDPTPEGPSSSFIGFVEFTSTDSIVFRRGWLEVSPKNYSVCQKSQYGFGAPTSFGHISYTTPNSPDANTLSEMDKIITSLKKI